MISYHVYNQDRQYIDVTYTHLSNVWSYLTIIHGQTEQLLQSFIDQWIYRYVAFDLIIAKINDEYDYRYVYHGLFHDKLMCVLRDLRWLGNGVMKYFLSDW